MTRIRKDYEARWRNRGIFNCLGGVRCYRLQEVDELLTSTRSQILGGFQPYQELEALGDWVIYEINRARDGLSHAEAVNVTYGEPLRGEPPEAVLVTFALPRLPSGSAQTIPAKSGEFRSEDKVNKELEAVDQDPLRSVETMMLDGNADIKIRFETTIGLGTYLDIHPLYNHNKTITITPPGDTIARGIYAFQVMNPNATDVLPSCGVTIIVNKKKMVNPAAPFPLMLVKPPCKFLHCSTKACKQPPR